MTSVPRINAETPFLQGVPNSLVSREWYRYLSSVSSLLGNGADILSLQDVQDYLFSLRKSNAGQKSVSQAVYFLTPQMFGAKGDGIHDDTEAIQKAINEQAARGGTLYVLFPGAHYLTTQPINVLTNAVHLLGAGRDLSVIAPVGFTGDYFLFDSVSECSISGMSFLPTGPQGGSRSSAIHFKNCDFSLARDFKIMGNTKTGVFVEGGASQFGNFIEEFKIGDCSLNGIWVGGSLLAQDCTIRNGVIAASTPGGTINGIFMDFASGVYVNQVDAISCQAGVATYPSATQYCTAMFFEQVLCDSCTGSGFSFYDNAGGTIHTGGFGQVSMVHLTNCWGATNQGNGVDFSTTCDGVTINGGAYYNNTQHGIHIGGGKNYNITGPMIGNNSIGSSTYSGIQVEGGTTHFTINGVRSGTVGRIGYLGASTQKYGIKIVTSANDYYTIVNNDCTDAVTAPIFDGGTGIHKTVCGNLPLVPNTLSSTLQITGQANPTQGKGLELMFNLVAGVYTSWISSYDRDNSAWLGLNALAYGFTFGANGGFFDTNTTFRSTGLSNPTVGEGLEVAYDSTGHTGYLVSADRAGGNLKGLNILAAQVTVQTVGSGLTPNNALSIQGDGLINTFKTFRVTGLLAPTSGAGVELAYDTSGTPTGYLVCFDRAGAGTPKGLNIWAGQYNFLYGGNSAGGSSSAMTISNTGIVDLVNTPTIGGTSLSTTYATLASPAFTGTPTAPTPATTVNNTEIATTAFVNHYAQFGSGTTVGTGGTAVTFGTAYNANPVVIPATVSGYFCTIDALSNTGFTINVRAYNTNASTNGIAFTWASVGR